MKQLIIILLFLIPLFLFSQKANTNSFTQEDWDKLSQQQKDSINKMLLTKFEEAKKAASNTDEENAKNSINEALKNIDGTASLTLTSFPKAQLPEEIVKLKNLEEFACIKCRQLDLNLLFNQLAQLPKLKRLNLSGGTFSVLPNSIKNLLALEELNLKDNNIKILPDSFVLLKKLHVLSLEHNAYLYDENVFERIKGLSIEELNFSASGLLELNNKVGDAKSLKKLDLSLC